jgi:hypothetical protein
MLSSHRAARSGPRPTDRAVGTLTEFDHDPTCRSVELAEEMAIRLGVARGHEGPVQRFGLATGGP